MIFLLAQQNETKKLLDYEINFTGDFDSYINEIINPITDDRDDLHTHSASKFLFHLFYSIYYILFILFYFYSIILFYFIEKMLEVSQGGISSMNISRVVEDIKIRNDTFDTFDSLFGYLFIFLFKHWLCIPKVSASNARKTY